MKTVDTRRINTTKFENYGCSEESPKLSLRDGWAIGTHQDTVTLKKELLDYHTKMLLFLVKF